MKVTPRSLTLLCYIAMMCMSLGALLPIFFTTIAASYGGETGLTQEQLGRLAATAAIGGILGVLGSGSLADRLGTKGFLLIGLTLISLGFLSAAFAPSYLLLAVSLFCLGLGGGMLDSVLNPLVAALNPERRTIAINWLHAFFFAGAVLTTLIGTAALRSGWNWRETCLAVFCLPLGLIPVFAWLRFPALVAAKDGGEVMPLSRLLRFRWFWGAMVVIACSAATHSGINRWLPAYAERWLGFEPWVGGVGLLCFSSGVAVARMLIGTFGAKWNMFNLIAWSSVATFSCFTIGVFLPVPWISFAGFVLVGFSSSALWPTMLGLTANRFPSGGARMFALLSVFGNIGGTITLWCVGVVADHSNLHWGLAITLLGPATILPVILVLKRYSQSHS